MQPDHLLFFLENQNPIPKAVTQHYGYDHNCNTNCFFFIFAHFTFVYIIIFPDKSMRWNSKK